MSIIYTPSYTTPIPAIPVSYTTPVVNSLPVVSDDIIIYSPLSPIDYYTYLPLTLPPEYDLNQQPEIRARLAETYYYKTLDKWLWNDLVEILNYVVISKF